MTVSLFIGFALAAASTRTDAPWVAPGALTVFTAALMLWVLTVFFRKQPRKILLLEAMSMGLLALMAQVFCALLYFYYLGGTDVAFPGAGILVLAGVCTAIYRFFSQRFRKAWKTGASDPASDGRALRAYSGGFAGIGLVIGGILAQNTGAVTAVVVGFTGCLLLSFLFGAIAMINLLKYRLFKPYTTGGRHHV